MSDETLTPTSYTPDTTKGWALDYAVRLPWPVYLLALLVAAAPSTYIAFYPPYGWGHVAVWAVSAIAIGLVALTIYRRWRDPWYTETHDGIEFQYQLPWYAPYNQILPVRAAVERNYEVAGERPGDWSDVWEGLTIRIHDRMIDTPAGKKPATYDSDSKTIDIYGPHLLTLGGLGYELSHVADQHLWPGQSEGEDLRRGRQLGIRPLQWPQQMEEA